MSDTAYALAAFISWALFLLVLMEANRSYLVVTGKVAANGFSPDNAGLSPFMQRLARAHASCIEGLPIFGGLLALAIRPQERRLPTHWHFGFLAPALRSRQSISSRRAQRQSPSASRLLPFRC